jgi:hypothetical protein
MTEKKQTRGFANKWNHVPTVPVGVSPLFSLPLNPVQICRWMLGDRPEPFQPLQDLRFVFPLSMFVVLI